MSERKTRVLLVGENPEVFSGNGNMMGACLGDIDDEKYEVCLFIKDSNIPIGLYQDPFKSMPTHNAPTVSAEDPDDPWGRRRLLHLLQSTAIDIVVFVGIDIWRYHDIFDHIKEIQKSRGFTWKVLVPYDLDHVREDWMNWLNYPDQVYVYSMHGYDLIKNYVSATKYYRPKLRFSELYQVASREDKEFIRKQIFPDVSSETEIFCYYGNNQIRKNIYNMIRGFADAFHKRNQKYNKNDMMLYIHTDNPEHPFSIERLKRDFQIPEGAVKHNAFSRKLWPHEMAAVLQATDCHLLPSLQEGLSWTVVETKLTGLPSIISDNTAHTDFHSITYKHNLPKPIIPIKPDQTELLPLISDYGPCYLQTNCCSHAAIKKAILQYMGNVKGNKGDEYKENIQKNARVMGVNWIHDCHNFQTDILEDEPEVTQTETDVEVL